MSTAPNGSWETMIPRVVRLLQNILALFRTRVDLTKREAQAIVRNVIIGVIYSGVAVLLVAIALTIAIVTLVLGLTMWLPAWEATGIVGVALLVIAGMLFFLARRRFARRRSGRLLDGLREDWKTIRDHLEGRP